MRRLGAKLPVFDGQCCDELVAPFGGVECLIWEQGRSPESGRRFQDVVADQPLSKVPRRQRR